MKELEKAKKAYSDILKLIKKHKETCIYDVETLEHESKLHLFSIELREVYGLNIDPNRVRSLDYIQCGEYTSIGQWGAKHNRTISWPHDDRQPDNELLFRIVFSTGAYIFSGNIGLFNAEYPKDFFQKFWNELKEYNPDYIDEHNHGLFWSIKNAKAIFNDFDGIYVKYCKLNNEDQKQRKIIKMKEELAKLENKNK